jgi:murein DD-endopeptidase MepM/ murein hydrolase activator NlpD
MFVKKLVFLFLTSMFLIQGMDIVFASNTTQPMPGLEILKGVVKKGDTAASLLNKYLPLKTIYEIDRLSAEVFSLTQIKKGQPYKIILKEEDLIGFVYEIDQNESLVVQKENGSFLINQEPIQYDTKLEVVSSTITSSLFESIRKAGETSDLARKLADIFAWDIDFIRDIQPGDQFQVLVEKQYREGKFSGYGKIQAAFFFNNGQEYKAFLHENENGVPGYYDEKGASLQKRFLRAPLDFSRISSGFTQKRMHPIFKEYRPHPGIDYAAPKGTPIKTVGDGAIAEIGYNKGMGKFIRIRHANGYDTCYNHMSKFAKGMKKGKRVVQGEKIGYVGMTGYATGPHLDFRMKKKGKLVNPLKHKQLPAHPINPEEMNQYRSKIQRLSRQMVLAHKPADAADRNSI